METEKHNGWSQNFVLSSARTKGLGTENCHLKYKRITLSLEQLSLRDQGP